MSRRGSAALSAGPTSVLCGGASAAYARSMTRAEREAAEARLRKLSDDQLLDEWGNRQHDTEECDLIAGEMERRNLDE